MRDEVKLTVLFGRLLDLLTRGTETTDDHRAALRALVEMVASRSMTIVVAGGQVVVEGFAVPDDTPFAEVVRARFTLHDVARVLIGCGASAVDLAQVLRALATPPTTTPAAHLAEQLRQGRVATVAIVSTDVESVHQAQLETRITEALKAPATPRQRPAGLVPGEIAPESRTDAYDEMVRQQGAQGNTLVAAVARLADESDSLALLSKLDQVQHGLTKALNTGELNQAIEAILRMIRQEKDATSPETQRAYGIALRRVLTSDTLRRFAPYVFDEVYHHDIVLLMRRAGTQGTKTLLNLLIEAPSQAERRACLKALRMLEEGMDVITSLLNHHEWFVVRNAADLVGELKIAEAAAALGKAISHDDPRVRRSVGLALARIGTPETALHLRKMLVDPDPDVRLAVVKEVGGRALGGLAMPLVSAAEAEEDPEVLGEFYRALGRIGTPDAVQALIKAAAGGGLFSRKPLAPRLAAIEALGLAGSPPALEALKEIAGGRSGDIRAAATAALDRARRTPGATEG
jgi:HEAT repeat protein